MSFFGTFVSISFGFIDSAALKTASNSSVTHTQNLLCVATDLSLIPTLYNHNSHSYPHPNYIINLYQISDDPCILLMIT